MLNTCLFVSLGLPTGMSAAASARVPQLLAAGDGARAQLCADFGAEARVKLAKPPSHADIDAALDRFLREGWLVEAAGAPRRLILGPRAFAELHDTIRLAVDERCPICAEVVVFGELVTVDDRAWWQRARAAVLCKVLSHDPPPPPFLPAPPPAASPSRSGGTSAAP